MTTVTAKARMRIDLASLAMCALLVDRDGRVIAANRSAQRLFGATDQPLIGQPLSDRIPDLPADALRLYFSGPARARRRDVTGKKHDGTQMSLRVGIARIRHERKSTLLITVSDRTRRRVLETADRDSRYGFRVLAQALPQTLCTWTPQGMLEFIGPKWALFTGQPLEASVGNGWLACIHPEERAVVEATRKASLATSSTFKAEFRVRRHDGEYQWHEATVVPLQGRDGLFVRWIGIVDNIHEARENRMALIGERDRFAKLVSSVPSVLFSFRVAPDATYAFTFATDGIVDFIGGFAGEIAAGIDRADRPRVHSDDVPRLKLSLEEAGRHLKPWQGEWRVEHPKRGEIWVEAHSVPSRDEDGSIIWYGIMTDITRRKHAERELQRSQARLQAAVMASGIGTYIWDAVTGQLWWDDILLKLFDRTREEVESGGIEGAANFVVPEDRVLVTNAMVPVWQGKSDTLHVEYRSQRRDGALQWISVSGRADRDSNGKVIRMTGACTDITDRKRTDESRRNSQRIEALGTLAGGIAHDFNNLLLAIAGNSRLAMSDLTPGHPAQRSLEEIERATARATDLVHRILAFSHQSEPKRAVIDLQPTIEEALRLLRATLPALINIRSDFGAQSLAVDADSTQIHQIVMNLVTNSAHAIGDRAGLVYLTVMPIQIAAGDTEAPAELVPGKYARIRVQDSGSGMSKATLDRIFDPFFTTKPLGQGTGLGLSVVHGIVRAHDGAITVHSEPGSGATFDVYLPAADRTDAVATPTADVPFVPGRGQRVMYVDDEDSLVFLVSRVLERNGYVVTGFVDPVQALEAFRIRPRDYDVVVTDLSMPGMTGFTLARSILAIRPDVPVLMTSGYVRPQDREAAEQVGIREMILKPDTIDELGRSLERLFKLYQHS